MDDDETDQHQNESELQDAQDEFDDILDYAADDCIGNVVDAEASMDEDSSYLDDDFVDLVSLADRMYYKLTLVQGA